MKKGVDSPHAIKCSFCGRGQDEVTKLVSGPQVYICNECIKLCNDILEEEMGRENASVSVDLPKPVEIKASLDEYVIGQERAKKALSVGLLGNAADIVPELVRRGVKPDIVTDQTSAHDPTNGYLPLNWLKEFSR